MKSWSVKFTRLVLVWLLVICGLPNSVVRADASNFRIYKDFTYAKDNIRCALSSNHTRDGALRPNNYPEMAEFYLEIDDLGQAIGAELIAEYWGGHIGTSDQKFKLNGCDFMALPTIKNAPSAPQCYYRNILGASAPVPLEHLKTGTNVMQFSLGPQTWYSFNWAWYFLYSVTIRVFYDTSRPHPVGGVTLPVSGSVIGDLPKLAVEASSPNEQQNHGSDFSGLLRRFRLERHG